MSKKVFDTIKATLEKEGVWYEIVDHEPVFTSEQAAKIRGTQMASGAKALVLKASGKFIMVVLPGDRRMDSKKFKSAHGIKDLRFATPQEVEQIADGVKVGAVHPLGNIHGMAVYVDKKLGENEKIVFNAGLHDRSIIMLYKDYIKIVSPTVGDFSL